MRYVAHDETEYHAASKCLANENHDYRCHPARYCEFEVLLRTDRSWSSRSSALKDIRQLLETLSRRCSDLELEALIQAVLTGDAFPKDRPGQIVLSRICSQIGMLSRSRSEALAEILDPSLDATAEADEVDPPTFQDAVKKIKAAQTLSYLFDIQDRIVAWERDWEFDERRSRDLRRTLTKEAKAVTAQHSFTYQAFDGDQAVRFCTICAGREYPDLVFDCRPGLLDPFTPVLDYIEARCARDFESGKWGRATKAAKALLAASSYMRISAIPTTINGIVYRSQLEAKWAAFFTKLNVRHQYEPYALDNYIPDFLLLDQETLVEVKPEALMQNFIPHLERMARAGHVGKALVLGVSPILVNERWHIGLMGDVLPDGELTNVDGASLYACSSCSGHHLFRNGIDSCHKTEGKELVPATASASEQAWALACNTTQWKRSR